MKMKLLLFLIVVLGFAIAQNFDESKCSASMNSVYLALIDICQCAHLGDETNVGACVYKQLCHMKPYQYHQAFCFLVNAHNGPNTTTCMTSINGVCDNYTETEFVGAPALCTEFNGLPGLCL